MKNRIYIWCLFFLSIGLNAQNTTNILLIGNSITYYNNMPQTLKAIANDKGNISNVTMYAPGGTGFINHVEDENVYNHFKQGGWDFVVLQPGSGESGGTSQTKEQTLVRAKKLNDSIRKYNPCAKILYYEISNGVWGNTTENLNTYNSVMDNIRTNVEYWADNTSTFFAPAGEAMRTAWNNDTNTMLWGSTGNIHPNIEGSYLIACTIYAAIFQKKSLGANVIPNGMTEEKAQYYQKLADNTVLNNLANWRINTYNQHTDFSYLVNQNTIQFTNQSTNAASYLWDFGDGETSIEENPTHQYTQSGTYEVSLTTYNETCQEKIEKQITFYLSTREENINKLLIYPNPFGNKIYLKGKIKINEVKLYNAVGQRMDLEIIETNNSYYQIDTSVLKTGIYFLEVNGKIEKLIKN